MESSLLFIGDATVIVCHAVDFAAGIDDVVVCTETDGQRDIGDKDRSILRT